MHDGDQIRRVFLADGDALVLPTRRLLAILEAIRTHLPGVHRISSYCLPRNLRKKSQAEIDDTLAQLIQLGHVSKQTIRGETVLKVNLGRRKARTNTLDKDIWDSLNFDEK